LASTADQEVRSAQERGSGLIVSGEALFFPHRSRIPELVAKHKLPASYEFRVFVEAGGPIN
jgi:hypothetical protein